MNTCGYDDEYDSDLWEGWSEAEVYIRGQWISAKVYRRGLEGFRTSPQPSFFYPFLRLPRELRDLVFQHAALGNGSITMKYSSSSRRWQRSGDRDVTLWSLVQTSKQMAAEALPYLYKDITFVLEITAWKLDFVDRLEGRIAFELMSSLILTFSTHRVLNCFESVLKRINHGAGLDRLEIY
ncbi:Hypothetical protein D9617_4g002250 [Elsinoe fawcettii]|nr:Hypothetical protein D9617_4g002250 [Elsinoe fawcettii]